LRPKYISDEIAFWFPNFSRATVGDSSETAVELRKKVVNLNIDPISVGAHLGRELAAAATAAAAPAPGIAPNPNRGNAADLGVPTLDLDALPLVVVVAVWFALSPISLAFLNASASFLAFSSSSSRCLSYPNCLIRSASSKAFRSASAKSTGFVLDAPSPSLDFLGSVVVDDVDEAELSREVPLPSLAGRAAADEVMVRGAGVVLAVVLVELDADGVLPMIGGVAIRGVPGADPLGVEGLDHESKKSSSVSSFGAGVALASTPSTTIPFGNLLQNQSTLTYGHN
jgi:hypothetical protein